MNKKIKNFIFLATFTLITNFLSCQQTNIEDNNFHFNNNITNEELSVIFSTSELNLNPHTSSNLDESQILDSLYEGLFSLNHISNEVDFALATDYMISRNQLHWTFIIREDAMFSDGTKITSNDVKESWLNLIATPGAYYSSTFDIIKGAKEYRLNKGKREDVAIFAKDEKTLSLELNSPISYLPKILTHHAFSVFPSEQEKYSGPYILKSFTKENIILEKNGFYHSAENVQIPKIKISFSTDSDLNTYLFNIGKVHWITGHCDTKKILLRNSIKIDGIYGTFFYFFKLKNPILTEKLRVALMDATPWTDLRKGSLFPATTLIPVEKNYPQPAPLYYTDYDRANLLIKDAKKELGLKETDKIELTIAIPEDTSYHTSANILKKAWEKIGVNLNIKVVKGSYYSQISKIETDLIVYTWIGDFIDPCAFLDLFRSDSTLNESNWKNKEFDLLLDKANSTKNQIERLTILSNAEDILLSSGMIIPISHSITLNIVDTTELGGWTSNIRDIHPFKFMYFKEPKSNYSHGIIVKK